MSRLPRMQFAPMPTDVASIVEQFEDRKIMHLLSRLCQQLKRIAQHRVHGLRLSDIAPLTRLLQIVRMRIQEGEDTAEQRQLLIASVDPILRLLGKPLESTRSFEEIMCYNVMADALNEVSEYLCMDQFKLLQLSAADTLQSFLDAAVVFQSASPHKTSAVDAIPQSFMNLPLSRTVPNVFDQNTHYRIIQESEAVPVMLACIYQTSVDAIKRGVLAVDAQSGMELSPQTLPLDAQVVLRMAQVGRDMSFCAGVAEVLAHEGVFQALEPLLANISESHPVCAVLIEWLWNVLELAGGVCFQTRPSRECAGRLVGCFKRILQGMLQRARGHGKQLMKDRSQLILGVLSNLARHRHDDSDRQGDASCCVQNGFVFQESFARSGLTRLLLKAVLSDKEAVQEHTTSTAANRLAIQDLFSLRCTIWPLLAHLVHHHRNLSLLAEMEFVRHLLLYFEDASPDDGEQFSAHHVQSLWSHSQLEQLRLLALRCMLSLVPWSPTLFSGMNGARVLLRFIAQHGVCHTSALAMRVLLVACTSVEGRQGEIELLESVADEDTFLLFVDAFTVKLAEPLSHSATWLTALRTDILSLAGALLVADDTGKGSRSFVRRSSMLQLLHAVVVQATMQYKTGMMVEEAARSSALTSTRSVSMGMGSAVSGINGGMVPLQLQAVELNPSLVSASFNCLAQAIGNSRKNASRFLVLNGVDALLDCLQVCPSVLRKCILSCLADVLCVAGKARRFFFEWRSDKGEPAVALLLSVWREVLASAQPVLPGTVSLSHSSQLTSRSSDANSNPSTARPSARCTIVHTSRSSQNSRVHMDTEQTERQQQEELFAAIHAVLLAARGGVSEHQEQPWQVEDSSLVTSLDAEDVSTLMEVMCWGSLCRAKAWRQVQHELEDEGIRPVRADREFLDGQVQRGEAIKNAMADKRTHLEHQQRQEERADLLQSVEERERRLRTALPPGYHLPGRTASHVASRVHKLSKEEKDLMCNRSLLKEKTMKTVLRLDSSSQEAGHESTKEQSGASDTLGESHSTADSDYIDVAVRSTSQMEMAQLSATME